MIKNIEETMLGLGEDYLQMRDYIKKIIRNANKNDLSELKKIKKQIQNDFKIIDKNLDNIQRKADSMVFLGLEEDSITSFAVYSFALDLRNRYLSNIRQSFQEFKTKLYGSVLDGLKNTL
ncbi:MAG: hypothetical protein GXP45_03000 [bacterium]|nr:hypothetical protein [bacterium]